MSQLVDNDMYLLFNMAFDGLDKTDLKNASHDEDIADVVSYLHTQEDKPQIAVINTRNREYPKAVLYRKMVHGNVVMFAFWKRGTICESMVASLEGVSVLNEFLWVEDVSAGKFVATLKPKANLTKKNERMAMMRRVAITMTVVDPLNKKEYRDIFGGDILNKLQTERSAVLDKLKERGLVQTDAVDPIYRESEPDTGVSESADKESSGDSDKHSELIAVQKDGAMVLTTQVVSVEEDLGAKLIKEMEREKQVEIIQEERRAQKEQAEQEEHERLEQAKIKNEELRKAGKLGE